MTNIAIVPKATRSPHNDGADLTAWTASVEFGEGFETGRNWPTTVTPTPSGQRVVGNTKSSTCEESPKPDSRWLHINMVYTFLKSITS